MNRIGRARSFAVVACLLSCGAPSTNPSPPPVASFSSASERVDTSLSDAAAPAPTASATQNPPTAIEAAALGSTRAFDIARSLADEVGPRLSGSPGDKLAVAWAVRTMNDLGFANVHTEPVTEPAWKRGLEIAEIVDPTHQPLAVTALGWSGATPKNGITADVMEVESLDALTKLPKDSAKGKIIFVNVVMRKTKDGEGYGEAVPARYVGPKAAMDAGAAAFLIRSVGTELSRAPHAGSTMLREIKSPIAAGALSTTDAELLHATLAKNHSAKIHLVLTPEKSGEAQSANVVGELTGTTNKDQIVLLGAHLDSWDLGRGAIDDGAGCAIVMEALRVISQNARSAGKQGLSRTVRVVLYAGEEYTGLAGGKAYAAAHASEIDKHVLAMEADTGTDRAMAVKILADPAKLSAWSEVAASLVPLGIAKADGDARGGADISPLVALGVPAIEVRQDVSRYFDIHHTAEDTSDKLDAQGLAQVAAAFAEIASRVADSQVDFGRVPEAKRKRE